MIGGLNLAHSEQTEAYACDVLGPLWRRVSTARDRACVLRKYDGRNELLLCWEDLQLNEAVIDTI